MISFDKNRLNTLFDAFNHQTILVIGDLMIDHYVWGDIARISPEAPVPVVDVLSEEYKLGGAANVSYNIASLGAVVIPVGVVGDDEHGKVLADLFESAGISTDGLFVDKSRRTTIKSRIIARDQHVVRTDREDKGPISEKMVHNIVNYVKEHLHRIDSIIFEDYNKGLLVPTLIKQVVQLANENHISVCVDPKFEHFFDYECVTLFKPNRKEVMDRLGFVKMEKEDLKKAGKTLMERLDCSALLITLGELGMALFEKDQALSVIPTKAVKVHDVSGAGDTVIATMAVCLAAGSSLKEAATIANQAAGLVCGQVGIVPVNKHELMDALSRD